MESTETVVETTPVVQADSTPAPEQEAQIEVSSTAEEHTEEGGAEPTRAEKRIKQLVSKQREAERDAAYWRGVAEASRNTAPTQTDALVVPVAQTAAPKLENFDSYEEFEAAKEEYIVFKAEQRILQAQRAERTVSEAAEAHEKFLERVDKASKDDPEIAEYVTDTTLPVSNEMASVIRESELGPQLLKYLGQNRKEATRLRNLSRKNPLAAVREMGRIEERLAARPKPVVNRISAAPEPVKTITSTGSVVADELKLSMDEWVARRNAQQFKRG